MDMGVTGERTDYRKFGNEVNNGYNGQEKYFGYYDTKRGYGNKWNEFRNNEGGMAFVCEWDAKNPLVFTKAVSMITVKKGKTTSLKYQVYPLKTRVTFKSSNKKVVTVTKKGVVKGVKKGAAFFNYII